jgi:hypothetical protein
MAPLLAKDKTLFGSNIQMLPQPSQTVGEAGKQANKSEKLKWKEGKLGSL